MVAASDLPFLSTLSIIPNSVRRRASLALKLFCALSVAACGGDGPTDPNGSQPATVATVVVSPSSSSLSSIGETVQLTASARTSNGSVISGRTFTWSSSDAEVATVDANGLVTAVANGSVTITATTGSVSGSATIDVTILGPIPNSGYWVGFTSQGYTVSFRTTAQDVIEQLGVRIKVAPPGGGSCIGNFAADGPVQLTDGAFSASLSNPVFKISTSSGPLSMTAQGSFSSSSIASGSVAEYTGPWYFFCKYTAFFGTGGTLIPPSTWEARPLVPESSELRFTSVSVGSSHSCGVTDDGVAYCWGNNDDGQLGDGTSESRIYPVPVSGGLTFSSVQVGLFHTCGLTTNETAYCWGQNKYGSLGNGTNTDSPIPVPVAGGLEFALVTAGSYSYLSCGLTKSGAAYCWGGGAATPVAVAGDLTFTQLSLGWHACGLTTVGSAYCWGVNYDGQLGTGDTSASNVPVPVTGGLTFSSISVGQRHTCGVTTSGVGYCWGDDYREQLGNGQGDDSTVPVVVAGGLTFATISAGENHTCALTTSSDAYCWGYNGGGALGVGFGNAEGTRYGSHEEPLPVFGELEFVSINAGNSKTCGITPSGIAYCWGAASRCGIGREEGWAEVPIPLTPIYQ